MITYLHTIQKETAMDPEKGQKDVVKTTSMDIGKNEELRSLPPLTERQAECLIYLYNYFIEHRYYPTQREIANKMNLKTNSAATFVEPLRKKGYLEKEPGKRRNIDLTHRALEKLKLMGMA
jgi:DNA-binding MarR family transcriptional regulator